MRLDVREGAQWDAALQVAVAAFGQLDVLVNNAGIIHTGYARDLTMAQHRDMVEVNYLGVVGGVMAALPLMREQGHGQIVDVCSMTSFLPLTGYATYGGTKHAMRAFHHSVAIEERGGPVAFTIIHPPAVRTPMLEQEMADDSSVLAFAERSVAPSEIAEAIVDAFATRPVEIIFPKLMGRVQQLAGVFPSLMREVIPRTEARARPTRPSCSDPEPGTEWPAPGWVSGRIGLSQRRSGRPSCQLRLPGSQTHPLRRRHPLPPRNSRRIAPSLARRV